MNKRLSVVFFMLITVLLSAQSSLIRMPRISPNAQEMAFSYQGDIWIQFVKGCLVQFLNPKNSVLVRGAIYFNPRTPPNINGYKYPAFLRKLKPLLYFSSDCK